VASRTGEEWRVSVWRGVRDRPLPLLAGISLYLLFLFLFAYLSVAGCSEAEVSTGACTVWLRANPFWSSFYSNLMATFAGAVLGFGVALDGYRRAQADRRAQELADDARRRAADDERRQEEAAREERQRQAQREIEARQRAAEREAESRQRQAEREIEARQRQAEREAEERRARGRRASELTALASMLEIVTGEIRVIRAVVEENLPSLRKGVAVDFSLTPSSWNAFSRDLLPALVADGEAKQLATKLAIFYRQMDLTRSMQRTLAEERRGALFPLPFLARRAFGNIVTTVEDVLRQADDLGPLARAQMKAWREQATALRSQSGPAPGSPATTL
jgi:hypothetical protein